MSTPTALTKTPARMALIRRGAAQALAAARPPRPLAALLVVTALVGVAWAFVTPPFQAPDEPAHLGYVQLVAESLELPGRPSGGRLSSEEDLAGSLSNADQAAQQIGVPMEWSRAAYERWRVQQARLPHDARTDGDGPNPASSNPPLYYALEAPAYRLAEGGDLMARLHTARLASVGWMLLTVVGVWLLAGELFRRDRLLQLAAAGTAGLIPMVGFVSASVNPDAMLFATWSLAFWLGARLLKRGLTPARATALFAIVGAACVVKATSYALLPGALFVLAVGLRRASHDAPRRRIAALGGAVAGLGLTLGVWIVLARLMDRAAAAQVADATGASAFNPREFASYIWQYYLPRLPFQRPFPIPGEHLPAYDVWLETGWAAFGWLEVKFPEPVYAFLAAFTCGVAVAAIAGLWRARRRVDLAVVAYFALVSLALIIGLHWTEYTFLKSGAGPFNAGRYLLPLVGLAGLAVAMAVRGLRPARRPVAVAALLSAGFVLNLFSFGLMMERFYA